MPTEHVLVIIACLVVAVESAYLLQWLDRRRHGPERTVLMADRLGQLVFFVILAAWFWWLGLRPHSMTRLFGVVGADELVAFLSIMRAVTLMPLVLYTVSERRG